MTDTDTSPEAVERLASIEDNGGCADLQFTGYGPTLRALSARVAGLQGELQEVYRFRDKWFRRALDNKRRAEAAEANLARAVEFIEGCEGESEYSAADYFTRRKARATLAEIKETE